MEPYEIYEILKSAKAVAEKQVEECYAAFPEDVFVAKNGVSFLESALRKAVTDYVRSRGEECKGIDLTAIKTKAQYGVCGLAKLIGVSTETVRRWVKNPKHPLKAHYRRTDSHRMYFIGEEVVRAMNARMA